MERINSPTPTNTMNAPFHTHTSGLVTVRWYYDQDSGPPWEQADGHGPVRNLNHARDKRPGERPFGHHGWFYDWQEAIKIAKRDGWGPGTPAEAVEADFKYLKGWVNDDWFYCGYVVEIDGHPEYSDSLWGIDSPSTDQFTAEAVENAEAWLAQENAAAQDYACRC